jgi:hypothetical protein
MVVKVVLLSICHNRDLDKQVYSLLAGNERAQYPLQPTS